MKLLFSIVVFLLSCRFVVGQNPCEINIKQELSKTWKYDDNKKAYFADSKFLSEIDSAYKDCLYGKDTAYISKLFGQHYSIIQNGKYLRIEFPLIPYSDKRFGFFYFSLNEKYQVIKNYFKIIDKGITSN